MSIRDIRQQASQGGIITRGLESWRLKYEREHGRKPDGWWHPSSVSGCPTAAVYEYLGFVIPGAPHDARLLRIFDTGHAVHGMLQSQFTKAGMTANIPWPVERVHEEVSFDGVSTLTKVPAGTASPGVEVPIQDEPHKLRGTLDIIFDIKGLRFVGELKTKHSSSFAKMVDAQEDHKIQAACYHWKALDYGWVNTDYAAVIYYSKDDSHIAEYKVPITEERITKIKEKLALMNEWVALFKGSGTFPSPYYKEPQKPPCRTCKWAQGCHATLRREEWINNIMREQNNEPTQPTPQVPAQAGATARKPPVRIRK